MNYKYFLFLRSGVETDSNDATPENSIEAKLFISVQIKFFLDL